MKKTRVVIPALALIAFSTAASITGTVAWFSVNSSVSVTGMTVSTKVASSILIANDTIDSVAKANESNFNNGPLEQTVTGILEPASTINGTSFFYTTNAKADGDAKADTYTAYDASPANKVASQAAFATAYGQTGDTTVLPYVDYVFQLKVTNTDANALDLKLTALNLTYTPSAAEADGEVAYRVAIFVENITSSNPSGTLGVTTGTANGIYKPSGAVNFSDDGDTAHKAIGAASGVPVQLNLNGGSDHKYNLLNKLAEVPVATTSVPASYYKVITRLYIEGEDTTCKNTTFAVLNGSWSLNLDVTLGTATTNVTALTIN